MKFDEIEQSDLVKLNTLRFGELGSLLFKCRNYTCSDAHEEKESTENLKKK